MPQSKKDTSAGVSIPVSVTLQQSPTGDKSPLPVAYVFTDSGHFLTRTAIDNDVSVTLTIPSVSTARKVRVVVGPELTGEKQPALSDLIRRGAQQQFVRIDPDAPISTVAFEIPSENWLCWFRFCLVQGTLLKSVISGGLPLDLPVCNAQVQIWEVEPLEIILAKVPVSIIEKLRKVILNPPMEANPGATTVKPNLSRAQGSVQVEYAKPVPTLSPAPTSDLLNLQAIAQTADSATFRQALIVNLIDGGGCVQELVDTAVGNIGRFGEDGILRTEGAKLARHAIGGLRIQRRLAVPVHVAQRHENLQRLVLRRFAAKPE